MRYLALIGTVLLLLSTFTAEGHSGAIKKCAQLITDGLSLSDVFILLASGKLEKDGHLPRAQVATYRLIRMEGAEASADRAELQQAFEEVLSAYEMTAADWKSIQEVTFDKASLASPAFLTLLGNATDNHQPLSATQKEAFKKLHTAAEAARERLKALLSASEQVSFAETNTLLSEEALTNLLRRFSRNPKLSLTYLGVEDLATWRYELLTERDTFRNDVEKALVSALTAAVSRNAEIPESDAAAVTAIAEQMGVPPSEVAQYFGEKRLFSTMNDLITLTRKKHPAAFKKVINRRFFTAEKQKVMLDAVRHSDNVIIFKLAENQDLLNYPAIKRLSESLGGAPIVVAPAFAEIGLIPEKLDWLFKEPNVHFMVDMGIQITRDFYVVDLGYEDKREDPFTGMETLFQPTDRAVSFHVKVRSRTRATANYDVRPGFFMSTGSMSDPAYWGKFNISRNTDARAQREAEINRSVVVLSRKYRSPKLGRLVGSANGIAPRRVRFSDERYGNPAGLFDLGKLYTDTGVIELKRIPALVLGDLHLGATDPLFLKATFDALVKLRIVEKNPDYGTALQAEYRQGPVSLGAVVIHDLIDGGPNNEHMIDSLVTLAIQDSKGALGLQNHVQSAAAWLKQLCQLLPHTKMVVPIDNHGSDWLMKKLQKAELFKAHRKNDVPLVLRLMIDAIETGANPYERLFQYFGIDTDQVLFMDKEDTFRVGIDLENPVPFQMTQGVEVGQHSQIGVNGAKSINLKKLLVAYGANVTGHTHSSAEYGQSVKVGTGTKPRQDYHRGPSNSDASIALVYSDQAIQLLRLERDSFIPGEEGQRAEEFFPGPEYPRPLIHKMPPGGPTTDQFRSDPPTTRGGMR